MAKVLFNPCLVTLLKLMITQKKNKRFSNTMTIDDIREVSKVVTGNNVVNTGFEKHFTKEESYSYTSHSISQLLAYIKEDFGYRDFVDFENENTDETVLKYYKNLKERKQEYKKNEQDDIRVWAENRCTYLFDKLAKSKEISKINTQFYSYLKEQTVLFEKIYLDIAPAETTIPLQTIKVPNVFVKNNRIEESQKADELVILEEILSRNRTIIVAESGSGKSTLCKWIFCKYANQVLSEVSNEFPIYINLKSSSSIWNHLLTLLGPNSTKNQLVEALQPVIPIIICDGFDENENTQQIITELLEFTQIFDQCKVFITSRLNNDLQDFYSKGYLRFEVKNERHTHLPALLLKEEQTLQSFRKYEIEMEVPSNIEENYLLYTFFILDFKHNGYFNRALNKGQILRTIFEHYYIKNWELAEKKDRDDINLSSNTIFNILSIIALFSYYRNLFKAEGITKYLFNNHTVYTQAGVTDECLHSIYSLGGIKNESLYDALTKFYCTSGILNKKTNDTYHFNNNNFQDYFLARGINLVCFSEENLEPFSSRNGIKTQLEVLFLNSTKNIELKQLVAGLVHDPNKVLNKLYLPIVKFKLPTQRSYLLSTSFICALIGAHNNTIEDFLKEKVLKQLLYIHDFAIPLVYGVSIHRILYAYSDGFHWGIRENLLLTKDEGVLETVLHWFIKHNSHLTFFDKVSYWEYFLLFPRNQSIHRWCLEILESHNWAKNGYFDIKKITFLHRYYPEEMIDFYLKVLDKPDKFNTITPSKHAFYLIAEREIIPIWTYLFEIEKNISGLLKQFVLLIVMRGLSEDNTVVRKVCLNFIQYFPGKYKNDLEVIMENGLIKDWLMSAIQ